MPIHDYECKECGKVSELLLRNSDNTARCPQCGSMNMEKKISASYSIRMEATEPGATCCGRAERCDKPPCAGGETCRRD